MRLRHFQLLFLGRSLSTISDALVPAALSLAIVLATGTAAALATVLACALVPRLLLLPLGGVLADRFNVRRIAIAADLTRCATQTAVAIELFGDHPRLLPIAIAQAVAGAASACAMPTVSPLVAGVVEGPLRQRANALMGVSRSIAQLFGPALAGLLILTVGSGWVFVVDAAAFATSALLLAVIRVTRVPAPTRSLRADLTSGWVEVRSRSWLWSSLVAHAVWNFAAGVLLTLGPMLAVTELGGQAVWVAVLQAGGVGLLIGSLLSGRVRLRRPVLVTNLLLASYAAPLTLFAVRAPVPLIVVSYGVALIMLGFLNPTWETLLQNAIPPHALARVSSYDWLFSLAAQPLGFMIAPITAAVWGAQLPLVAAAVLVVVASVGTAAMPGVREFHTPGTDDQRDQAGNPPPPTTVDDPVSGATHVV